MVWPNEVCLRSREALVAHPPFRPESARFSECSADHPGVGFPWGVPRFEYVPFRYRVVLCTPSRIAHSSNTHSLTRFGSSVVLDKFFEVFLMNLSRFLKACSVRGYMVSTGYPSQHCGKLQLTAFMLKLWRMLFCQPPVSLTALVVLSRNHW
jgi:hypothetical protein